MLCKSCGTVLDIEQGARLIVELGKLARKAGIPDPDHWAVQIGPRCANCIPNVSGGEAAEDRAR